MKSGFIIKTLICSSAAQHTNLPEQRRRFDNKKGGSGFFRMQSKRQPLAHRSVVQKSKNQCRSIQSFFDATLLIPGRFVTVGAASPDWIPPLAQ
jgi:hypothetical protein